MDGQTDRQMNIAKSHFDVIFFQVAFGLDTVLVKDLMTGQEAPYRHDTQIISCTGQYSAGRGVK